ncbi:inorganic diphosphatase [Endozoicomonas sp. SM1973]|uniref:Inorganic pyrophosphatase n=1 Tax=Spartinivicinus marinus TaxID=2994442 RepID=A0A853HZE5_9GAMM|nr:inorganic diphosphatase [Spartinivicinus marinus]MCX4026070.1 inorganic diphosphatase [Spartinivicinus marinus]NYZ66553.1 inorganic diphosphatase [Spartinivicinus marinus]
MSYNDIAPGKDVPNDIYVAIEIPANSNVPVKYEIDKDSDQVFVDRFIATPMFYPANYGYIPQTLADDGDPLDVLVVTPFPVAVGSVMRCRPVGVLNMSDESGEDAKLIAVPHDKLTTLYKDVKEYTDLPELLIKQIEHFFENYKDLEEGKWVKIDGWKGSEAAKQAILDSVKAYKK